MKIKNRLLRVILMSALMMAMLVNTMASAADVDGDPFGLEDYINVGGAGPGTVYNIPLNSSLQMSLTYTTDKPDYFAGETAGITLTVQSDVGDANSGENKNYVLVVYDQGGTPIIYQPAATKQGEDLVQGLTRTYPVVSYPIPALQATGIFNLTYKIFDNGSFDEQWMSTVVGEGKIPINVIEEEEEDPINLWVSADDGAILYFNSNSTPVIPTVTTYNASEKHLVLGGDNEPLTGTPFVAVEAWDTSGKANIAGFKMVFDIADGGYLSTGASWYYYYNAGLAPDPDGSSRMWYEEDYDGTGWYPVTSYTLAQAPLDRNWALDTDFPDLSATWIWDENFNVGNGEPSSDSIDTPVYFRSAPVTHDIEVVIIGSGTATVNGGLDITVIDGAPLEFLYEAATGFSFSGWDVSLPTNATESAIYTITFIEDEEEPPTTPPNPTTPRPSPRPTQYTLTVNVVGDGTVPGYEGTNSHSSGVVVNMTALIDDEDTEFVGWSDDATGILLSTSVTMTGNKTVTATFAPIVILDEVIVEAAPEAIALEEIPEEELPQTGGIPIEGLGLMGSSLIGLGFMIRKKK